MDRKAPPPQRVLEMLESLLRLPAGDLKATLTHIADLLADATGADKVDAFLYDDKRDSLVAIGTSTQPCQSVTFQVAPTTIRKSRWIGRSRWLRML